MKRQLAATAIIAAFAGCASTPPADQTSRDDGARSSAPVASAQTPRPSDTAGAGAAANNQGSAPGGVAAVSAPSQRSVFFDYDSNVVKDEFAPVVQSNARYAAQQRSSRVTIEGNTDERGSREYNLALGQQRADAVKQRLTLLGVPAQQIETVSFGEEKPRVQAENEQAYAQNRRADIVYGK